MSKTAISDSQITFWVVIAHGLMLLSYAFFASEFAFFPPTKKKMIVQTMTIRKSEVEKSELAYVPKVWEKEKPKAKPIQKPAAKLKSKPKLNTKQNPKKSPAKQAEKPAEKPTQDKHVSEAISKARQRLKKIEKDTPLKNEIALLGKDEINIKLDEESYLDLLKMVIQQALRLPEKGDVKVSLTLGREGVVQEFSIVESKNPVNSTYAEKTIPLLSFPPFGKYFLGKSSHTFLITLELFE